MSSSAPRVIALAVGDILIFGAVAAILLKVMPGPLKPIDYLVIGGIATLVSLLVLFAAIVSTWMKMPFDLKRRKPEPPPT